MSRLGHGEAPTTQAATRNFGPAMAAAAKKAGLGTKPTDFGYLFPELQGDPNNRLPTGAATVNALKVLGDAMRDDDASVGDSPVPAVFTYFGQFLDHDITLDTTSASLTQLAADSLQPLAGLGGITNLRSSTLDLDSVYGGPRDPANNNKMLVGPVSALNRPQRPTLPVPGKSKFNDLPRQPRSADPNEDRAALIGDPRNDENTIVAQLHTAFLKAHNSLVDEGKTFDQAKKALVQRYQNIVLNDFLPRVCDPYVVKDAISTPPKHYSGNTFMPVEFSAAGYRFGHSMVRTEYDFNLNFNSFDTPEFKASLDRLFTFTALSGQLGPPGETDTLPENWVIQWERIAELQPNKKPQMARKFDARLTPLLFELKNVLGQSAAESETDAKAKDIAPKLAIRNLLRGYLFGLPTGQAVARAMGVAPLSGNDLIAALPTLELKAAAEFFKDRTPLWFYVLAEAGNPKGADGKHLGAVGSKIVAETLVSLIRRSPISVLGGDKEPTLTSFKLTDLLKLADRQDQVQISGGPQTFRKAG